MPVVAPNPLRRNFMCRNHLVQSPPEIKVPHIPRRIGRPSPTELLPSRHPRSDGISHILTVSQKRHLTRPPKCFKSTDHRHNLHTVIRGVVLSARAMSALPAGELAQQPRPTTRPRISDTGTVRNQHYFVHRDPRDYLYALSVTDSGRCYTSAARA